MTRSDELDLLERLGGSGATVHRAVLRTTGRVIVVKHAPWDRPDVADRLAREAAVLARVEHPSLVRLLDVVEDEHGRSLVLAHAPGGSLRDRTGRLGPLRPVVVADLGARLARALTTLHGAGVVHRDVHPGNVLIDAELQPVLADLDRALDTHGAPLPQDEEVVGHPDHVDPRLFSGAVAGPASDLHSLATTLWNTATGTPPPRSGPEARVRLPVDGPLPPELTRVLRDCLDGQFTDAATAAVALEATAARLARGDSASARHEPGADAAPATEDVVSATTALDRGSRPAHEVSDDPAGSQLLAGGVGGPGDATTRSWGPAPKRRPVEAALREPQARRVLVAAALGLVVLLAAVAATMLLGSPREPGHGGPAVVTAPPPCTADDAARAAEAEAEGVATGDDPLLADLDADGCSEVVRLASGVLHTPEGRYGLGVAGDRLLAGDWDGDGRWGVGLYRPATGEVFLFDEPPGPGATSRPVQQHRTEGRPRVVVAPGGGHEVLVEPAA